MEKKYQIIFLGCGSSSSTPTISCLLDKEKAYECNCEDAIKDPNSIYNRLNPSIFIKSKTQNILVDCGKTFRTAVLKHLLPNSVKILFHSNFNVSLKISL